MTIYCHFASKEGLFEAVVRDRTDRVMGGLAGVDALDPRQPQKALLAIGEQFLTLAREEATLGQFRLIYGAAAVQREACRAFYRQGADRQIGDLAAYLRRADAQGTLNIRRPRQAADLFLSMWRWPHPRAHDARYARRAGRQGAAAGSGAGVPGGLCEGTLTEEDQGEMNSQAPTGDSSS